MMDMQLRPEDTEMEFVRFIRSAHINAYGTLYGGWMMKWIVDAASTVAVRLARGPAVLGYLDDLHFLSPILPGELAIYRARAEHTSEHSVVVSVEVWSEDPTSGRRKPATSSLLSYVAVDHEGRPRRLPVTILGTELGARFYETVRKRVKDRREKALNLDLHGYQLVSSLLVREEHLLDSELMYAGHLLYLLDEVGSITALKHIRGPAVTACLDRLAFYTPMRKGDIVHLYSRITRVWNTSMEVSVKTIVEKPEGMRHATTSYMVFVAMGDEGPRKIPPMEGGDPEADRRRKERFEVLERIKSQMRASSETR